MRPIPDKPPLPTNVEPGPQSSYLRDLVKGLVELLSSMAYRLNRVAPKDGTELIKALSLDSYTPAQITANQNDYDPDEGNDEIHTIYRVSADAARNITGIARGNANESEGGRVAIFINIGSPGMNAISFMHEDAASVAANRITINKSLQEIKGAEAVGFWYDSTSSRWRMIAIGVPL